MNYVIIKKNRRGWAMEENNEMRRLNEELAFKVNVDGKEIICYIVLHFKDKESGNDYIVYTDGSKKEDGTLDLLASRYKIENDEMILKDIEFDWEYDLIDEMLKKVGDDDGFNN